jgi:fused signal recognition particle receptor
VFWRRKPREEAAPEGQDGLEPAPVPADWEPDPADFDDPETEVGPAPPAPTPTAEPAPTPVAESAPDPVAEPDLEPSPGPVVAPGPAAEAAPAPDPVAPAPVVAPAPEAVWDPQAWVEAAGSLETGVARSRGGFMSRLRGILGDPSVDGKSWDEVEETLIGGDVGGQLAVEVVERARRRHDPAGNLAGVRAELAALLVPRDVDWRPRPASVDQPAVVLIVGVNGTGKTTTIGKLAGRYRAEGMSVILAAADTFRAAAIEQLGIWARRSGSTMIAHAPGADPGAVVYDALDAAVARGTDLVIADTAGRLHTKVNLMDELAKIRRIIDKRLPGAQPEVLFVLDATTGQNGLAQARAFHEATGLTGIVLTKLDSTAKGGIVFAIEADLGVPVRFVGVGEQVGDLLPFDPDAFVEALFADS